VSARDPDGDALSYAWQIDGAPAPGTLSSMNYSPLVGAASSHTIKVTVSDGKGGSVSQIWNVTVSAPTNLPTITSAATATPNPANVGESVTLSVAASNDANEAMTYSWDFGDSAHASGASAAHAYAAAGTYTTTVTVSDAAGSVQSSVTVTVSTAISDTTDDHLGSITAQGDNAVKGEGMAQAFDNNIKTKWLDYAKSNPTTRASWIQYVYAPGISGNLTSYTITSANDYPSRDPRDWQLLGSNDGGATWTVVDSQGGQQFTARSQKRTFNLNGSPTYHAYRLNIQRVWAPSNTGSLDGNSVQLSEIELLGVKVTSVPAPTANAPQTVAALKMSGTLNTKSGVDASTLLGVLTLTPDFSAAGAQVHLDVNGATADFTLGKTGRAKNENGTFSLASKKGSTAAAFKAKLTKLGLNDIWGGKGVTPNGGTLSVTLKLDVNGQAYSIPLNLMVTSTDREILKFKSQ
jgi:PKD repeat protein